MKQYLYIIAVCSILLSICYGCSIKKYNIDTSMTLDSLATLVAEKTPALCSYRGKAAVSIKGSQNISFSVLLNKKCNNDTLINVLGALNNPLASIKYENKNIEVYTQNQQNSEDIKNIADKFIFHIISFLKTPQIIPDNSQYSISFNNSSYIFTSKSGTKIYADDKFRLYKYITGSITAEYIWDENNILKSIIVNAPEGSVAVHFLNKTGWSFNNGK